MRRSVRRMSHCTRGARRRHAFPTGRAKVPQPGRPPCATVMLLRRNELPRIRRSAGRCPADPGLVLRRYCAGIRLLTEGLRALLLSQRDHRVDPCSSPRRPSSPVTDETVHSSIATRRPFESPHRPSRFQTPPSRRAIPKSGQECATSQRTDARPYRRPLPLPPNEPVDSCVSH